MFVSRPWFAVLAFCAFQFAAAQNKSNSEIEQHIQHVTSDLMDPVVVKGDSHATHTLADWMKELDIPGVSIAVLHNGKIEWARGFGVRSIGGPAVDDATLFQAASISKPL